jgi:hypothetical protein
MLNPRISLILRKEIDPEDILPSKCKDKDLAILHSAFIPSNQLLFLYQLFAPKFR